MKHIFSDNVVSKLRNIPTFVWVLFVAISFYFANAYELLLAGEIYADMYTKLDVNINIATIGVMFSLLEAIIFMGIFELIISIVYNFVVGRFRCQINRSDFKFRLRYFIILVNLVIGVLSIGYFFTQIENGVVNPNIKFFTGKVNIVAATNPYYIIQSSILPFTITTILFVFFFDDFRKRYVPTRNQAPLFKSVAMIYIGVSVIMFLVNLFQTFLLVKDPTPPNVYEIVAYSLTAVSYVVVSIIYYFYYKKIKKSNEEIQIEIITPEQENNNKKKDENIFDDFGF